MIRLTESDRNTINEDSAFNHKWYTHIVDIEDYEIEEALGEIDDKSEILDYMKEWDCGEYTDDDYDIDIHEDYSKYDYVLIYEPYGTYYLYRKLSDNEIQEEIDRFGYIGNQRTGKFYK